MGLLVGVAKNNSLYDHLYETYIRSLPSRGDKEEKTPHSGSGPSQGLDCSPEFKAAQEFVCRTLDRLN